MNEVPEGHTIHRLARDLNADLAGHVVHVSSPQGRFVAADGLDGSVFEGAHAAGKHLFLDFSDDSHVHVHLGLIGTFRPSAADEAPRDTVRLRIERDGVAWNLIGPQWCTAVTPDRVDDVVDLLGPDPLATRPKPRRFVDQVAKSRKAIGALLLDQNVIAGIGNVYRAEILFLEGIHPNTVSAELPTETIAAIWKQTVRQLRRGVKLNRIVTVERCDAPRPLSRLHDDERLYVYKRAGEPCRRCSSTIEISTVAGRSMWHCPSCQPRHLT